MQKTIKILKYTALAFCIFGLFFALGAGASTYVKILDFDSEPVADDTSDEPEIEEDDDGERTNILVLGIDKRPGDENSRSDTMILASIDPKLKKVALISIPRDTRVDVPGSPLDKICTANYAGGPQYAVEIVEDFMDINIDHYVEMDFNGFESIIDTLGGVTINVPQRMYKPSEGINLHPGTQELNGKQALAFVRYRSYEFGDIDRTSMQQDFLMALADEVLQSSTIRKLPALTKEMSDYVTTDMGISDMLRMANWARKFDSSSIITQTLPGYFYDKYNEQDELEQSYWIADRKEIGSLLETMFSGETVAVIHASPYPPHVPKPKNNEQDEIADNDIQNLNEQRANLPSPGHNGELDSAGYTPGRVEVVDVSGPEGYI